MGDHGPDRWFEPRHPLDIAGDSGPWASQFAPAWCPHCWTHPRASLVGMGQAHCGVWAQMPTLRGSLAEGPSQGASSHCASWVYILPLCSRRALFRFATSGREARTAETDRLRGAELEAGTPCWVAPGSSSAGISWMGRGRRCGLHGDLGGGRHVLPGSKTRCNIGRGGDSG